MMDMITMNGINKSIKGTAILTDVSLHVPECQVYGLLGPNGAGKSSLLKIMTGAWHADSGAVLFREEPWSQQAGKQIGSMIEGAAVYPNLSATENLDVVCRLFGYPAERIPDVLQQVGLMETGKKPVKQFSMGMKQRLGIAVALIGEPSLLILDEPTNGLDPVGIQELRDMLRTLPTHGVTVLVSSHILSEIHAVSDKIGILCNGKLVYEGDNTASAQELERLFMTRIGHGEVGVC